MTFSPGTQIYKFTLNHYLGGYFGEVWEATDNTIGKTVAVKILDSSFQSIAEQLEEARIGNKFNHRNLLQIHYADVAEFNGVTYTLISQEYIPGGAVTSLLNSNHFMPLQQVLKVLKDILLGLEYLHSSGFYHNDIKPGNILIDANGNALLADYGISGYSSTSSPVTPTNAYMVHCAPETTGTNPQISVQSDIYQVGCTAYRLLNGISHLSSDFSSMGDVAYVDAKVKGKMPNTKKYEHYVPQSLKTIINKSLSTDPAQRFGSVLEMRRKLEKLSYNGYWNVDATGNLVGYGKKWTYRYERNQIKPNNWQVIAYQKNNGSGIESRKSEFCKRGLTSKDAEKLVKKFFEWVINNG